MSNVANADSIFNFCSRATSILFPDDIKFIGNGAFGMCQSLKDIVIPETVTRIDDHAFEDCIRLKTVYSKIKNPFYVADNAFTMKDGKFTDAILYVPSGTKPAYEATACWNKFNTIVEGDPTDLNDILIGNGEKMQNSEIYTINGMRAKPTSKGLHIINGRKVIIR